MSDVLSTLDISKEQIEGFCKRHRIRRLAFFGSVLRENFRSDSDVDVLYEFEPGHETGHDIVAVVDELEAMLGGRNVDFVPFKGVRNPFLRQNIRRSHQVVYAA
ncbi:MAG: nucleotidyltransferase domain-containing protein [Planctomycetaceae bacterium]|nr:nucleotidyltransferase domain-containing protein [Planctomycetaceae bacterium]